MTINAATIRLTFLMLLLCGCANRGPIELSPDNRAKLGATEVVAVIPQEEINAEIIESNAATRALQGGLLAALIDANVNNSRLKEAEKTVDPYRNALIDYDFPQRFRDALESELRASSSFKNAHVTVQRSPGKDGPKPPIAGATPASTLVLTTRYSMVSDFSLLNVRVDAKLLLNSDSTRTPVYTHSFVSGRRAPEGEGDLAARWTINNGVGLKTAMDESIHDVVHFVVRGVDGDSTNAAAR